MDAVDFERSTMVRAGPDAAFAFLSDPLHLPEYVTAVTHVESTAVDGDLTVEAGSSGDDGARETRFLADAAARRIEWGDPDAAYGGSMVVDDGPLAGTSQVTIHLRTSGDTDPAAIDRVLDQAVRNIQRLLTGR